MTNSATITEGDTMTETEMTAAEFDLAVERANTFVRQQTAEFLDTLSDSLAGIGGWEMTTACYHQDLTHEPVADVARTIIAAMGGNVC
jgi:hypothetical protein